MKWSGPGHKAAVERGSQDFDYFHVNKPQGKKVSLVNFRGIVALD